MGKFCNTTCRTILPVYGEKLLVCGDLNGHVGAETDGCEGVHGGVGFCNINV